MDMQSMGSEYDAKLRSDLEKEIGTDLDPELQYKLEHLTPEEEEQLKKELSANMAEYDYSNIISGGGTGESRIQDSPRIDIKYDKTEGMYQYLYPDGEGFMMNVPLGSVVNEPVRIYTLGDTVIRNYTQDGVKIEVEGAGLLGKGIRQLSTATAGSYDFFVETGTALRSDLSNGHYRSRFSFILADSENPVHSFLLKAPLGYRIGKVTLNGSEIEVKDDQYFSLTDDGYYAVTYVGDSTSELPDYQTEFRRDTTAPYMVFSEDISKEIEGTVYFHPSEQDAEVAVYLNGSQVVSEQIEGASAGGNYRIVVSDIYGNNNEYEFSIKEKRTTSWPLYSAFFAIAVISGLMIAAVSRRRLRVR